MCVSTHSAVLVGELPGGLVTVAIDGMRVQAGVELDRDHAGVEAAIELIAHFVGRVVRVDAAVAEDPAGEVAHGRKRLVVAHDIVRADARVRG